MKHKVKHLHFIADHARNGCCHCSGRPYLLAQIPADTDAETYEA